MFLNALSAILIFVFFSSPFLSINIERYILILLLLLSMTYYYE